MLHKATSIGKWTLTNSSDTRTDSQRQASPLVSLRLLDLLIFVANLGLLPNAVGADPTLQQDEESSESLEGDSRCEDVSVNASLFSSPPFHRDLNRNTIDNTTENLIFSLFHYTCAHFASIGRDWMLSCTMLWRGQPIRIVAAMFQHIRCLIQMLLCCNRNP